MQRIAFKDYLRSTQLNREVSAAVRYAKDTPRKAQLMRDYLAGALADIDALLPQPTKEKKE